MNIFKSVQLWQNYGHESVARVFLAHPVVELFSSHTGPARLEFTYVGVSVHLRVGLGFASAQSVGHFAHHVSAAAANARRRRYCCCWCWRLAPGSWRCGAFIRLTTHPANSNIQPSITMSQQNCSKQEMDTVLDRMHSILYVWRSGKLVWVARGMDVLHVHPTSQERRS